MAKRFLIFIFILQWALVSFAQKKDLPKLFVGIVVDQMRAEYLDRFYDQFGENGFKRILNKGFDCRDVHINYIPSVTAAGHASIFSGTTPQYHGIIDDEWYNRQLKRVEYCVADSNEHIVGGENAKVGVSPRNLLVTNLGDELKISTGQKSRVIGLSLKDRAAILSAGHMADGAFWFDQKKGDFVSSTYYMAKLPEWVAGFNQEKHAEKYLKSIWNLLFPENQYPCSLPDDNNYENIVKGKVRPVFPYNLEDLSGKNNPRFRILYMSPFGNSLLTDLAIEAIQKAGLGKGDYPDLLTVSYSSPDAIGHNYGPLSKEMNDTYLRLDRDLARLFEALDQFVGKGNYTLFLTADHGTDEVPRYLMDHKIPAGYFNDDSVTNLAARYLDAGLGPGKWIEASYYGQFYLNRNLIKEKGLELEKVQNQLAGFLREQKGVAKVFTATQLDKQEYTRDIEASMQKGFFYRHCGDVEMVLEPGWTDDLSSASSHCTGYNYDTHIPLLWYGKGIRQGESVAHHDVTDIAPTVSMILHIKLPNASVGNPIQEILK
ncbi:MAG: alkaline phosphatase family protein [Bacteroidota bacterium]|nr:alkaline phosphatase family protein [Bacteroidota bacterium]